MLNPLELIARMPYGRRTLLKLMLPLLPKSMQSILYSVEGLKMHLDLTQVLDLQYLQHNYDRNELEFLASCYMPKMHLLDIGANQGYYSLYLARKFPDLQILAFEPDSYNINKFEKNIHANGFSNITLCKYALSDSDESRPLMMNVTNNRGGNSMVMSQKAWQKEDVIIEVPCRTLYNALTEHNVRGICAMKIDIEGFEFPVLKKFFGDAPLSLHPKAVVLEAFGHAIELVGGSPIELLINCGYKLVNHTSFNYFFVRKS